MSEFGVTEAEQKLVHAGVNVAAISPQKQGQEKIVAAAREVANRAAGKPQCVPVATRAKRHRDENKLLKKEVAGLRKQQTHVNAKSVQTGLAGGNKRKKVQEVQEAPAVAQTRCVKRRIGYKSSGLQHIPLEPICWISELKDDPHYRVGDEGLKQSGKCRKSRAYQRGRIVQFGISKKLGYDDATSMEKAGEYAGKCWEAAARNTRVDEEL